MLSPYNNMFIDNPPPPKQGYNNKMMSFELNGMGWLEKRINMISSIWCN